MARIGVFLNLTEFMHSCKLANFKQYVHLPVIQFIIFNIPGWPPGHK